MDESTSSSIHDHSATANGDGYAYKNEISLSIGDEDHNSGTNSTAVPTPSPRHIEIPVPGDDSEYTSLKDSGKLNGSSMNGLDNPAFESDKEKRPLSSFGHSGEKSLGVTSVNGKASSEKPLAEAVNLELLNMSKPSNGHQNGASALPVKKDTEVDIGDPYDEYFVPVNEHRKYMR